MDEDRLATRDGVAAGPPVAGAGEAALRRSEERLRLLADAGRLLNSALDYEATLADVCRLVVPTLADWCLLDLLSEDGRLQRLEVAHRDPARVELAREAQRRYPPQPDRRSGLTNVLRTGEAEVTYAITDEMLEKAAQDAEHLRLLRALELKSAMILPLKARGRTIGALTLIASESGRRYDDCDLPVALELASRIALAVDNARLFDEVRAAGRRKDEFLAMLSHELRNPLAAIRNAALVMKNSPGPMPEACAWGVDVVDRQVQHLVRLIDDLLDVSRITRGKIELRRRRIDAADVVASSIDSVRRVIDERRHRLEVDCESGLFVDADPTRLEQIVVNLLTNSARYTEPGGVIRVATHRDGDPGEVVIRVRDTGIGIPPDQLPRMFEVFAQGDRSLERAEGGLGLGLTLVRRPTEMHGGSVLAHSAGTGQGSEFIVRLPAAEAERVGK
jgi:signal transduction histidine kinase